MQTRIQRQSSGVKKLAGKTRRNPSSKKRGRKSKAELETMKAQQAEEIRTRRLALQGNRSLEENLADLPNLLRLGRQTQQQGSALYYFAFKNQDVFEKFGTCSNYRSEQAELSPAEKIRFHERSAAERGNSELKDNYGARNIRVKGHGKVLCHLIFGILALTVKTLFNML